MERRLNISHIQHFSVGDGPGIRTTVFFKGCRLRCPWCHNPETQSAAPETLVYAANGQRVTYGVPMTVVEVEKECRADHPFYAQSGGGVTVSGGECMLYPAELTALLALLKEPSHPGGVLHTVVDTAGCVPYVAFMAVNDYTDLYLFDLKTADADKYAAIGGDLEVVRENMTRLIREGKEVRVRIPLIPDFNTSPADLAALREVILATGATDVDLLPYHRLGSGKYTALGRDYAYRAIPPLPVTEAERMGETFREAGLTVRVEK